MLHGRDEERARLSRLVQQAMQGLAGAIVLFGEAGAGKSALLEDAVAAATDARVLRTQGLESEAPLAYAALHRLLRPILDSLDALPAPQARALRVAFGDAEGPAVEPFLVAVATLGLLTSAAEDQPLLCVIDDAHWLDAASADALLFAARRVHADPVALLFAARDDEAHRFTAEGVDALPLGGLDTAAAREVLTASAGAAVDAAVLDWLTQQTSGNPLALVELPGLLSPAQLAGDEPLPPALPLTARVERLFLDRCRRLPPDVQRLLLVVAADDSGKVSNVRTAAALLDLPPTALAEAEQAGLLHVDGDAVSVRHPLLRTAVYQAATSDERRAAHRALAASLSDGADRDRQTWHRAAAAEGPDDDVAAALERVAARAERSGGWSPAAAAFERAAELTRDGQRRAVLSFAAARNAWAGGQVTQAKELSAAVREATDDPLLLADVDRLRARIEVNVGSAAQGQRILANAAAAVAEHDAGRALEMYVASQLLQTYDTTAAAMADNAHLPSYLTEHDEADDARTTCLKSILTATARTSATADALAALRRALPASEVVQDSDVIVNAGNAALHLGDEAGLRRAYSRVLAGARDRSAAMTILYVLPRLAFAQFLAGEWSQLREAAHEALDLSAGTGKQPLMAAPLAWLTLLAAVQGQPDYGDLRTRLDLAREHHLGVLNDPVHDLSRWAAGAAAAHAGDTADALHHLSRLRLPAIIRMATLDRLDAAIRAEDLDLATCWSGEASEFAAQTQWPWALGAADYGRALLAAPSEAGAFFDTAVRHYEQAQRPYDLARVHLAYGEHLRRAQHRVDARPHLRRALSHFEDLRAEPSRARAAQELRASGETARKRNPSTALTLTPMELQVAQLVAQGLSNKAVAAQCWISPRTVAFHLRNVFAKAGVTTRGELAQLSLR